MTKKERQKRILDKCPNYNKICNYIYIESDNLTRRLIEHYQDYVFSVNIDDKSDINLLALVNKALEKFISDCNFASALKKYLTEYFDNQPDILTTQLMNEVTNFMKDYEEEMLKHVTNTRWI